MKGQSGMENKGEGTENKVKVRVGWRIRVKGQSGMENKGEGSEWDGE